jgi:putative membrane protein
MMYWNGDWNGWAWFTMGVSMLVFWGLVGLMVWLVVRASTSTPRSAEETLRHRYAEGELDDEEFQRRLRTLHQRSGVS